MNYQKKGLRKILNAAIDVDASHSGTPCYRMPVLGKITTRAVLLRFGSTLGFNPSAAF